MSTRYPRFRRNLRALIVYNCMFVCFDVFEFERTATTDIVRMKTMYTVDRWGNLMGANLPGPYLKEMKDAHAQWLENGMNGMFEYEVA